MYVLGSLFLLLSILAMSSIMSTTDFDTLFKGNFIYLTQLFLVYGVFIAFAVKTPVIFVNSWLLRAHVESPLGGSILLAAIVLKLSLYGILRIILPVLPKASIDCTPFIYLVLVITIIYASLSTLRTTDVKELVAYSSVCHAAVYVLGIFSNTIQGIEGGIILGLAHGLVSPGLFICAGGVLYDRSHTRVISFYRGLAQTMPVFAILFFILSLANAGTPLTVNFVGEFMSLYGAFERLQLMGALAASSIVFSAAYTIYMFNRIAFGGSLSRYIEKSIPDLNIREFSILAILVIITVLFGIYPAPLLDGLHYSVSTLIYSSDIPSELLYVLPASCLSKPATVETKPSLDPNYVTGFCDGESWFTVNIQKKQTLIGYQVSCIFGINLHERDLPLLKKIQQFFKGVGVIHRHGESSFSYIVRSVSDLKTIIEHFESYPLITKKRANYLLF